MYHTPTHSVEELMKVRNLYIAGAVITAGAGVVAVLTVTGAWSFGRVRRLWKGQITEVSTDSRPQDEELYRLPAQGVSESFETPLGTVRLVAQRYGYYSASGLFVYLPDGYMFPDEIKAAFLEETDYEFRLEDAPGHVQGGDDDASGFISAGLDYQAYLQGKQQDERRGHFTIGSAPRTDVMVGILTRLIKKFEGIMSTA